ncbi:uncharacterized protein LOC110529827 [Oncorhynchus mykiss]|uniref:uncharacterized protein LOC110529827 n=1 Tax=Oncorhynchus mykiss TaxID=8022 RepID=UPI001877C81F|nr:uncharacterized protein LOC110529827 [Oncorhynchus mykiss]
MTGKWLRSSVSYRRRFRAARQMTRSCNQQNESKPWNKSCSSDEMKTKRPNMPSAAALHTASQKEQNCLFCDSADHKSENCPGHNIATRKEKLKKIGRCFVCLGQKHIAKFCKVKDVPCATCGSRHHIAVCTGKRSEVQPPTVSEDAVVSSVIPHSVKMKPDGQNTVLLQTAKAWVEGPSGRKIARCLLDGGSHIVCFIHETLVKGLKLPVIRQEALTLHTFGSSAPATSQRNTAKVILENVWDKQQRIEIEAIETPQVCTAVMKVPGEQIQHELNRRGLQLADFPGDDNDPELSVLIGADYYWQIVSGRVERLTETLVALESTFGCRGNLLPRQPVCSSHLMKTH